MRERKIGGQILRHTGRGEGKRKRENGVKTDELDR